MPGHPYEQGIDLRLVPAKLAEPLRWKTPKMIFVNSMSDLFHKGVPDDYVEAVGCVMQQANWHTCPVLTKVTSASVHRFRSSSTFENTPDANVAIQELLRAIIANTVAVRRDDEAIIGANVAFCGAMAKARVERARALPHTRLAAPYLSHFSWTSPISQVFVREISLSAQRPQTTRSSYRPSDRKP